MERATSSHSVVTEPVEAGWTEYSVATVTSPTGHQVAVIRRRTSSSATVLRRSRSTQAAWTVPEFDDIWATLEGYVRQHLVVSGGLQLTLPFAD